MRQWLSKMFGKPAGSGTEANMAEKDKTPEITPAAGQGAPDLDAIVAAAVEKTLEAVTEKLTPLSEAVASLQEGQKALAEAVKTIPTPEAISQAAKAEIAAQNAGQARADARKAYLAEKAKDLPEVYQGLITGETPEDLAKSEQAAREKFKADFKAAGGKTPDVGGAAGGQPPAAAADLSKLSPIQKMEMGLATSKPIGPGGSR